MVKKILIIKTGETSPEIYGCCGGFADYIINQMDLPREKFIVSSVYENEDLPKQEDVSAIIITGSHSMVTDRELWSVAVEEYLRNVAGKGIPVLGICYGHQLICQAFGGIVGYHPKGKEIGTVNIELTDEGKKDKLLGVLPDKFLGHAVHSQSVFKLPEGAKLLAQNEFEHHHAFVIHDNIWGVQFHPEFNAEIVERYISEQGEELAGKGYDVDALHKSVEENEYGKIILKRFLELI